MNAVVVAAFLAQNEKNSSLALCLHIEVTSSHAQLAHSTAQSQLHGECAASGTGCVLLTSPCFVTKLAA